MKNNNIEYTGHYEETAKSIFVKDGKMLSKFRDSGLFIEENQIRIERQMKIKNRNIYVRSFFPSEATFTPTEKLLQLVSLNEK